MFFVRSFHCTRNDDSCVRFSTTTEWTALGGSADAATYLKEVDTQGLHHWEHHWIWIFKAKHPKSESPLGPGTFLKQCSEEEQQEAEKICNKHWAKPLPEACLAWVNCWASNMESVALGPVYWPKGKSDFRLSQKFEENSKERQKQY